MLASWTSWLQTAIDATNKHVLWGVPMLILLFGTHLFLTFRLRGIQRYIGTAIRLSFTREKDGSGDISPFGALSTALAATIGTGNIVGVAAAVAIGGPGAVLWCWLTGVFGIATKYAEALLAVKYRVRTSDGTMLGGPMYALQRGLGLGWLGGAFAVFTAIAAFGIGNTVQANSLATLAQSSFHVAPWVTALVLVVLTGLVILGGIQSISRACATLVPFMAISYIAGCVIILALNAQAIPGTIGLIVSSAFTGQAAAGGFIGATLMMVMRAGVSRGLFSNEAGMGSAPIVAAAAQTRNPVRQALVSATGTFWDTVVICALTGLVLVNTNAWSSGLKGAELTKYAFEHIPWPALGLVVLNLGLFTFVFSTLIGWTYYGERAVEYLFGKRAIFPYRLLWLLAIPVGCVASLDLVWGFADAVNALMAIPNLISLLLLNGVVVAETNKYLWSGNLDAFDEENAPVAAPTPIAESE